MSNNIQDTLVGPATGRWVKVLRQMGLGLREATEDQYYAIAVPKEAPLPEVDLEMCLRLAAISSIAGRDAATTGADRRQAIAQFIAKYGPLGIGFRQVRADGQGVLYGESEARWWQESFAVWQALYRATFLKVITVPKRRAKGLWWFTFVGNSPSGLATEGETAAARGAVIADLREQITEQLREHTALAVVGESLPMSMKIEANTPRGRIWRFLGERVTGAPVALRPCAGGCGTLLVAAAQRGYGQRADVKYCTSAACRKRAQRATFTREGLTARGTERKRAPNKAKRGGSSGKA